MWSLLLAATNSTHMLSLEPLRLVQSHISATLPDGGGPDTRQPPAHRLSQTRLALPPISKISSRLILYYVGKFSLGAFVSGGGRLRGWRRSWTSRDFIGVWTGGGHPPIHRHHSKGTNCRLHRPRHPSPPIDTLRTSPAELKQDT